MTLPIVDKILHPHQAHGFDLSSNNHVSGQPFEFLQAKQHGFDFVYVKATQGTDYVNEYLLGDTKNAHQAGFLVGIYHFYADGVNVEAQADYFFENGIAQVIRENGDILGIIPMFDYEVGEPNGEVRDAFLKRLAQHYAHMGGQYMGRSFFEAIGKGGKTTWLAWPGWEATDPLPEGVGIVQYGTNDIAGVGIADVNFTHDITQFEMAHILPPQPPVVTPPQPPVVDPPKPVQPPSSHKVFTFTERGDGAYDLEVTT